MKHKIWNMEQEIKKMKKIFFSAIFFDIFVLFVQAVYHVAGSKKLRFGQPYYAFLLFFLSFFITLPAYGAPSITSAPNSVADGQNITISGSTFGTGPTVYKWDDFQGETHAVGNEVGAGPGVTPWTHCMTSNRMTIAQGGRAGTNDHYARALFNSGYWSSGIAYTHGGSMHAAVMSQAYVTWFMKWSGTITGSNAKLAHPFANWCDGSYFYNGSVVQIGWNQQEQAQITASTGWPDGTCLDGGLAGYVNWGIAPGSFTSKNNWARYEVYGVESTANNWDGTLIESGQSSENSAWAALFNSPGNIRTRSLEQWHWYGSMFGRYASSEFGLEADYDDIYIASSRARIEIGDNAIFENCHHREIQTQRSWNSGTNNIQATVRQGSFQNGSTAYLFVIDENGEASEGYPITIGGESGITTPGVPNGLSVS